MENDTVCCSLFWKEKAAKNQRSSWAGRWELARTKPIEPRRFVRYIYFRGRGEKITLTKEEHTLHPLQIGAEWQQFNHQKRWGKSWRSQLQRANLKHMFEWKPRTGDFFWRQGHDEWKRQQTLWFVRPIQAGSFKSTTWRHWQRWKYRNQHWHWLAL